jgi:hypothetical protein
MRRSGEIPEITFLAGFLSEKWCFRTIFWFLSQMEAGFFERLSKSLNITCVYMGLRDAS